MGVKNASAKALPQDCAEMVGDEPLSRISALVSLPTQFAVQRSNTLTWPHQPHKKLSIGQRKMAASKEAAILPRCRVFYAVN